MRVCAQKMILPLLLSTMLATVASAAPERAIYDVSGKLTALICGDAKLAVRTQFVVGFEGGVEVPMQPDADGCLTRDRLERHWTGDISFPNGGRASISTVWTEAAQGVSQDSILTARSDLDVQFADCVIDVPRAEFAGGRLEPSGIALPVSKPDDVTFFRGTVDRLAFADTAGARKLSMQLDHPCQVTVTDRWDAVGRSYRVRVSQRAGAWKKGETLRLNLTLQPTAAVAALPVAQLSVNPDTPQYPFDGYGGNYCWDAQPAMTTFMLDHLQHAWTRHELKADMWDQERAAPGTMLVEDFEMMRRMQRLGLPWIISVWHLPQRFYSDANQRPRGSFGRTIAPERWDDLLDLLGSYLLYLKERYAAEPDLFSFNEPDLGVDIALTPETHRDAVKRIGAYLAARGLKTKMLLGDAANPRDTYRFVLAAAADQDTMRYVGAVSFHSWGGGSPAQYEAWADVAAWLRLPLLVAEVGVDPGAYRNHTYDSYDYGLAEAAQRQELLRYARPSALLFWQFTTDYGLLRFAADGSVEPTARFWLAKHFTDLTLRHSLALTSASNQPEVLISAFRRDNALVLHILNLGAARDAVISGLPEGTWRMVTTTESLFFHETSVHLAASGTLTVPARGIVTLLR